MITRCFRFFRALEPSGCVPRIQRAQSLSHKASHDGIFMGFQTEPVFPFSLRQLMEQDGTNPLPEPVRKYLLREAAASAARVHAAIREPHCVLLDDMFITESYRVVWDGGFFRAVDLDSTSIGEIRRHLALPPPASIADTRALTAPPTRKVPASGAGSDRTEGEAAAAAAATASDAGKATDLRDFLQSVIDLVPGLPARWIVGDGAEFPEDIRIPLARTEPAILPPVYKPGV